MTAISASEDLRIQSVTEETAELEDGSLKNKISGINVSE